MIENENDLYKISDSAAEFLLGIASEDHDFIISILKLLPLPSMRIMIASLSDAGFTTKNESLIYFVSSFLSNENKAIAQTSAIFLLSCCGSLGGKLVAQGKDKVPHAILVNGIIELLSGQGAIA